MTSLWYLAVFLAGFPSIATADWQFRSRPDLAPPRLNITVPAQQGSVEEGFIFVAPYPGSAPGHQGPDQPAAYIFRDDGDLIWSGLGYFAACAGNFGVDTWNGEQVLRIFQGQNSETLGRAYGYHSILNNKYENIKTVRGLSNKLGSAHEFRVIDGKTALVEIGTTKPVGLSPWGGVKGQDWIISTGFQELDIENGEVLFEWESLDHVDPKYSLFPLLSEGSAHIGWDSSSAWDYFHLNSADKDSDGNYIISARHAAAIYKINGTDGEVIWTLGGLDSSFEVEAEAHFAFQHDVRLLHRSADHSIEILSLFDNAAATPEMKINPFSRARIIQLNHTAGTAKALHTYPAPDGLSVKSQGNAQVFSSGNVFVNWGEAGAITEFSADGDVFFHAYLDSAPRDRLVQNYRGFRFNWTGTPSEKPAIFAVGGYASGDVDVYASWNGDTVTRAWRFYAEPLGNQRQGQNKERTLLGEAERKSFETHIKLDVSQLSGEFLVSADAVDGRNTVLRRTEPVTVLQKALLSPPSTESVSEEKQAWEEL
ncbi:hypothetical protein G7Z17_g11614 [Cylindrodendrum hubeiense]|uniref:ASST-domain-containing protein n=1 Tax=Cylindrodendrum hubeiense TaxID=595255 RepID=A0A9P5L3T0_9HYPO|nr:hypothetical protein G7Z17_g11614 [Cylindrodendrum hubeiense]